MRALVLAALACVFSLLAAAETPAHVLKFRAFQEALNRGDRAAASELGAEALRLAQANGASGKTIEALAVNLAGLRLVAGLPDAATPLAQASALAAQGETAASPETLELLQAWAGLDTTPAARTRLKTALEAGQDVEITWRWGASQALINAASAATDWAMMRRASDFALAAAEGANLPLDAARGRALTLRAAAALMGRRPLASIDTRLNRELDGAAIDSRDAVDLLEPFAEHGVDGEITIGVQLYAEARAWHAAITSLRRSNGMHRASDAPRSKRDTSDSSKLNLCAFDLPEPEVKFPDDAFRKGYVGGVSALVFIGPGGKSEDVKILAEVPAAKFSEPVRKGMLGLPFKVKQGQPANCRSSYWYFYTFHFVLR